jgi:hypothetical protein
MPGDTEPAHNARCVCDIFIWEDVLGRDKVITFKPFAAIKAFVDDDRCHLCSLLYGSMKVYNPPEGYIKLRDDCPCAAEGDALVQMYGRSNYISIKVCCGGPRGQWHMAILQLSTMPHNRGSSIRPMEQQIIC